MGLMMRGEENWTLRPQTRQFFANRFAKIQFLAQPRWNDFGPRPPASGRDRKVSLEQAGKFCDRLVIENQGIDLIDRQPGMSETEGGCARRKALVVFSPGKPLFLGG